MTAPELSNPSVKTDSANQQSQVLPERFPVICIDGPSGAGKGTVHRRGQELIKPGVRSSCPRR